MNFILAILTGFLLYLGWPSNGFPLLGFIGFVPLLFLEYKISKSNTKLKGLKVFLFSYFSLLIWNFFTSWWLHYSSLGGAILAITANTLLMALVFTIYSTVNKNLGNKLGLLFLVCLWIAFEKMHLHWEVAWPWLNLGNAFANYSNWIQWYEYTGTFGGSLWIWIVNIIIFKNLIKFTQTKDKIYLYRLSLKTLLLICCPIFISYYILNSYQEKGKKLNTVIVQPNLDPYNNKYKYSDEDITTKVLQLLENNIDNNTHFVVMPETTFHQGINVNKLDEYPAIKRLKKYLKSYPKLNFLLGITSLKYYYDKKDITSTARKHNDFWYDVYNSAIQVNKDNDISIYHKSKLVPGVEIMPYKNMFGPLLGELTIDLGGSTGTLGTQQKREVFKHPNYSIYVAPIICYESVFGQYVTEYINKGAGVLAIMTNDGWWSTSDGYRQHLEYTKLRAIETRRHIVRSANTGVSCIINQKGEILKSLTYSKTGSFTGKVKYNTSKTFYTKYGDYIARLAIFIMAILFIYTINRKILLKLKK